ncbi:DUF922 domain-containing protein [Hyphobacterium marinum]|uniref:DUF922 domain-containing protein n=1 Tax=Hyphobacterium marinum TaxID=3116574 RepID=A0ABU7LV39_9PROT|nr:DUF922 domain-containing protein [Hyphobacterium sp. Y6023]MEE2565351.1 DUF922 domain-containing protein [Hyphobacterium sp. Y6023]
MSLAAIPTTDRLTVLAGALAVFIFVSGASASQDGRVTISESESESHYEVTGLTPRHLANSFRNQPRRGEMARTDGGLSLAFDFAYGGEGCRLTGGDIAITIHTTYPRWRERDRGPQVMREEWDRFMAALREHETIHGDLFRDEAHRLAGRLENLPPSPSCDGLHQSIAAERERFDRDINAAQAAYEIRTRNGASQGARLRFREMGSAD